MADNFPTFPFTTQEDWYGELSFISADDGSPLSLEGRNFVMLITPASSGAELVEPKIILTMESGGGLSLKSGDPSTIIFRVPKETARDLQRMEYTADVLEVVSGNRYLFMPARIQYFEPSALRTFLSRFLGVKVSFASRRQPIITPVAVPGREGKPGATIVRGTVPPVSAVGRDGDYYIEDRTASGQGRRMWGPKSGGAWPGSPWTIEVAVYDDVPGLVDVLTSKAATQDPTFTGTPKINGSAGSGKSVRFLTAAVARAEFGTSNDPETGDNVGSDIFLNTYTDAGVYLGTPILIKRATGEARFANGLRTPVLALTGSASTGDVSGMSSRRSSEGATLRPLGDRDLRSVKDFGAKLDGSDDSAAYSAARFSVPPSGVIDVPEGRFNANFGGGPATPILWRMHGNTYDGTTPVVSIGKDTVETVLYGRKYLGVGSTNPDDAPVLRIDQNLDQTGGTEGAVINALKINQNIGAVAPKNYGWAFNATLSSKAYGVGQHTACSALAVRPPDALSDGRGPRATIWADYKEATSQTGQPSNLDGPLVIGEWDMYANGADPGGIRLGLHMLFSKYNQAGAAMGINSVFGIGTNDGGAENTRSYARKILNNALSFTEAGIDFSQAVARNEAPALRIAAGQDIAWEGSSSRRTRWIDGFWQTRVNGNEIFRLGDDGSTGQAGRAHFPVFNTPDQSAPASTADPAGAVGDVLFSGPFMYRKTTSGWLRTQMSAF